MAKKPHSAFTSHRPMQAPIAQLTFAVHPGLDQLPSSALGLFDGQQDFALSEAWFRNFVANGLPPHTEACFGVLSEGLTPIGLVPLQRDQRRDEFSSLTNCYTLLFAPLVAGEIPLADVARALGRELGRLCANRTTIRIDCLPSDWPGLEIFIGSVSEAGMSIRQFEHFGNWHERIADRSWKDYLASRTGNLRELLRRKERQAARIGRIEFEVISSEADLARGIDAFEEVYSRSWKPDEPYPRFNAGLICAAARLQALRLGIGWHRKRPIAAQIWIATNKRAIVMKLAHDQTFAGVSPGTLLTAVAIEALIEEGVEEIDFGRGDDSYKRLWARQRRQRIGLILLNPYRPRGLGTLARHDLGRLAKGIRDRIANSRTRH